MNFFSGFGGGGFPFGGAGHPHGQDDEVDEEVDNSKFYEVLQLPKDATAEQIKKQYREMAKRWHPDRKGGDQAKFKQISEAYQTLGDPEKRRIYDKYGSKGPQADGSDLMNMFFGGGGGMRSRGPPQKQKTKPIKKALQVTLEQCYNGQTIKIPHERVRCCEACQGKGGSEVINCKTCKGKGRVMQMYQMGPGMYQQVQKNCDACKGQGEIIEESKKCKVCKGKKIETQKKVVEVPLDKGSFHGHAINMYGEGNEYPDTLPGDLIFIVQEKPHDTFIRKGADLFMKKNISLVEALIGFEFQLKHLDGHIFNIYTPRGQIVADKTRKVVRGLGMPFLKSHSDFGNLIIDFHVQMPTRGTLSKEQLEGLAALLPGKINERPKGDYHMLDDFDKESVNTSEEGGKKNMEDEQEEGGEGGIGCQSQ